MPKCKNDPTRSYKGDEPSPKGLGYCAHGMKEGDKKKGKDGNMWIIKKVKNGSLRWQKIMDKKSKTKKQKTKKQNILLNPFITEIINPIIKNFEVTDNNIKKLEKNDTINIIDTKFGLDDYDLIVENFNFDKKNNNVKLLVSFEANKDNTTKDNQFKYYNHNNKFKLNKKTKKYKKIYSYLPIEKFVDNKKGFLKLDIDLDDKENEFFYIYIKQNLSFNKKYEKLQNQNVKNYLESGVIFTKMSKPIVNKLEKEIDKFSKNSKKDFHPFSNKKVRDLVHPSLFPYIKGKSKISIEMKNNKINENKKTDYWNRPYEKSKYQWLPSEFVIDNNGKCKIDSYINNLPEKNIDLKNSLEKLFDKVLPQFEKIWNYIQIAKLYNKTDNDILYKFGNEKYCDLIKEPKISLKNRNLQVITKIVTYELKDEEMEGAWHVEGMSHENIVATAVTVIEQTDNFDAKLYFKRRFTVCECSEISRVAGGSVNYMPNYISNFLGYGGFNDIVKTEVISGTQITGLIPLGKVQTKKYSLTVFPNSHIHKLDTNNLTKKVGKRTIVVFWLINPDVKVLSTKNIEPQQGKIKLSDAKKHRIKLMEERKYHKQKFNVRDLNLCEH